MRKFLWIFLTFTVFLFPYHAAFAGAPDQPFVVIVRVEGKGRATIRSHTGTERIAAERDHIFINDRVHTDADSTVDILLRDGSLVRVGLNSDYLLSDERFDPKAKTWAWIFELTKGSVRALIKKSQDLKNVKFRINTPSATIGVRGTQFIVEYFPVEKLTKLYTIEGTVFFGARDCDLKKTCVDVGKGKKTNLRESGAGKPAKPETFSEKELANGSPSDGMHGKDGPLTQDLGNKEAENDAQRALLEGAGKLDQDGKSAGEVDSASADALIKEGLELFKNEQNVLLGMPQELPESKSTSNSLSSSSSSASVSSGSQQSSSSQQQNSNSGAGVANSSVPSMQASDRTSNNDSLSSGSNGGSEISGSLSLRSSKSGGTPTNGSSTGSALSNSALEAINCIYTNCPISRSSTTIKTNTATSTASSLYPGSTGGGTSTNYKSVVAPTCTQSVCTSTFVCKDPTPPTPGGICNNPGSELACVQKTVACPNSSAH